MKEFTIGANDANQRLDRFLSKAVPLLPASLAQKYIRIKRIKLNGARAERDTRLKVGDVLQLYINDEFFDKPREDNAYLTVATPKLNIVYEDEHILLADKRPGLAVHPHDGAEYGRTLIDHIQAYLYQKREWSPRGENAFTPALCNRIDRNTEGLVIAAKNAQALRAMNEAIRERHVHKSYLAVTAAPLPKKKDVCTAWLKKDSRQNMVKVLDSPPDRSWQKISTGYRVLAQNGNYQLVHIDLLTGRTHQIRAHLAHLGAPLLGDPKYASGRSPEENQCLCSYSLHFSGLGDSCLSHLEGKRITAAMPEFVRKYFPDAVI